MIAWPRSRRTHAAAAVVTACVLLGGCKEVEEESATGYEPAKLEAIKGTDDAKRVTFTREGAQRVGLRTAAVRRSGAYAVVPYAALIYDAEGRTYVYRSPRPLSFERQRVTVERVDRDRALLSRGPAAGARVVTVGAAQVYGTELDVAGSH